MRMARTPRLMALASLALGGLLVFIGAVDNDTPATTAETLLQVYISTTMLFVTLFGPAIAGNAIALEREGRTWEALLMAGMTPRSIDQGKFLSAYSHLCLYLFTLLPAAAVPHLFGNVSLIETLLAVGMVFVAGALTVRFGLFVSASIPSARMALLCTVAGAAGLCFAIGTLGTVAAQLLSRVAGFHSVSGSTPAFWPVAAARESIGFDYFRYVWILPGVFVLASWVYLRELTRAAMSSGVDQYRGVRMAFIVLTPIISIALALFPKSAFESIYVAEIFFSLYLFLMIVVLGGDRPGGRMGATANSLLLLTGGVFGFLTIAVVPHLLNPTLVRHDYSGDHNLATLGAIVTYGIAFTLFLVGFAGVLRARLTRPGMARAALVLGTAFIALAPVLFALILSVHSDRETWPMMFSPFCVVEPLRVAGGAGVPFGVVFWTMVGVGLLLMARRDDRQRAAMSA
jgi:ABC-type transport system involved in multi-copper enzyme maturation permease subunit